MKTMNKLSIGLLLLGVMLLTQGSSCRKLSPERKAKNTIESVAIITDAGMQAWGQYVRENNVPVDSPIQTEVRAAYLKYQDAMSLAEKTVESLKANPTDEGYAVVLRTVAAISNDVILLIYKYLPTNKTSDLKLNSTQN